MGVPKFFRWLAERYPALLTRVNEYDIPAVDNFYLDMNGIIHSCSHPDDSDVNARISEAKIFQDVFAYIDTLVRIIGPRKVLFLAIDGVAPRAKMNQQRSRRFRAARASEEQEQKARMSGEWVEDQQQVDENDEKRFDSNTITPGTDFMCRLDACLQYLIQRQVNEDPMWRKLTVIYSSHLTPGEGEHKIMDYIRYARSQKDYDVRTRHCLYGLDADLIMLGMASHEPYFTLLREEVKFGPPKRSNDKSSSKEPQKNRADQITFFLMHLSLLRDYLELEFKDLKAILGVKFSTEAIIDDWVFMNMLVGNDFIPHLPFMHINKGSLQKFYEAYARAMPEMRGYMNDCGTLHVDRFMIFIRHIAQAEQELINESREDDEWLMAKTRRPIDTDDIWDDIDLNSTTTGTTAEEFNFDEPTDAVDGDEPKKVVVGVLKRPKQMSAAELEAAEHQAYAAFATDLREKYYKRKFGILQPSDDDVKTITHELVRALVWNLGYYYSGVQSWSWYYPYHYSPFASDIWRVCTADQFRDVIFADDSRGRPFMPFEQLMAVLPARSKPCLPVALRQLFSAESSIYDFYPVDFNQDMEDKLNEWEAVVCVPFVDEERLVAAVASVLPHLTDAERCRNAIQPSFIYNFEAGGVRRVVESPNLRALPTLHACAVTIQTLSYEQMLLPKDDIKYGLLVDRASLLKFRKGYPRFHFVRCSSKLVPAAVKVFLHCSRSVSIMLKVEPMLYANIEQLADDDDAIDLSNMMPPQQQQQQPEMNNLDARIDAEINIACEFLGRDILVNWPYLYEARVERVVNGLQSEQHVYDSLEGGLIKQSEYTAQDPAAFRRMTALVQMTFREKLAIDIGQTCVMLGVRRKIGHTLYYNTKDGGRTAQFKPEYEKELRLMPLQLCVPKQLSKLTVVEDDPVRMCGFRLMPNNNQQQIDAPQFLVDVKSIFQRNDIVFHLSTPFYGAIGQVLEVLEQTPALPRAGTGAWGTQPLPSIPRLMVRVQFLWQHEPDMNTLRQHYQSNLEPTYWSARDWGSHLRMHPKLVSNFTGTLYVLHSKKPGANIVKKKRNMMMLKNIAAGTYENDPDNDDDSADDENIENKNPARPGADPHKKAPKTNIGLNLKKNKTMREIRGYTRKDVRTGQWVYSDRVGAVLKKWRDQFPDAVDVLDQTLLQDIRVDKLFLNAEQPMEALKEMRKFINEQLLPESERVEQASGSDFIDDIGINELRNMVKYEKSGGENNQNVFTEAFRPQNLFKFLTGINDNAPADARPSYRIWDRVVNVRPNHAVPLGVRGTVTRVEYEEENMDTAGGDHHQQQQQFGGGGNNYNNNSEPKEPPRQRLIQVLWDMPFKSSSSTSAPVVTAGEVADDTTTTDLCDVPPSYLMNLTFGVRLKKEPTAFGASLRLKPTTLTVKDLVDGPSSSSVATTARKTIVGRPLLSASNTQPAAKHILDENVVENERAIRRRSDVEPKSQNSSMSVKSLFSNTAAADAVNALLLADVSFDAEQQQKQQTNEVDENFAEEEEEGGEIIDAVTPLPTFAVATGAESKNDAAASALKSLLRVQEQQQPQRVKSATATAAAAAAVGSGGAGTPKKEVDNSANVAFNMFLQNIMATENGSGGGSAQKNRNGKSPSKRSNNNKAGNADQRDLNEEWVNPNRDDYFDDDQRQWHAPTETETNTDNADNFNSNNSGMRGRGRGGFAVVRGMSRGMSAPAAAGLRGGLRGRGGSGSRSNVTVPFEYATSPPRRGMQPQQQQQFSGSAGPSRRGSGGGGFAPRANSNSFSKDDANYSIINSNVVAEDDDWNEEWSKPMTYNNRTSNSGRGRDKNNYNDIMRGRGRGGRGVGRGGGGSAGSFSRYAPADREDEDDDADAVQAGGFDNNNNNRFKEQKGTAADDAAGFEAGRWSAGGGGGGARRVHLTVGNDASRIRQQPNVLGGRIISNNNNNINSNSVGKYRRYDSRDAEDEDENNFAAGNYGSSNIKPYHGNNYGLFRGEAPPARSVGRFAEENRRRPPPDDNNYNFDQQPPQQQTFRTVRGTRIVGGGGSGNNNDDNGGGGVSNYNFQNNDYNFAGGGSQQQYPQYPRSSGRRSENNIPMPSNAAECVVYSADADDNENYDNNYNTARKQQQQQQQQQRQYAANNLSARFNRNDDADNDDYNEYSRSPKYAPPAVVNTQQQQQNKRSPPRGGGARVQSGASERKSEVSMTEALLDLDKLGADLPLPGDDEFAVSDAEDNNYNERSIRPPPKNTRDNNNNKFYADVAFYDDNKNLTVRDNIEDGRGSAYLNDKMNQKLNALANSFTKIDFVRGEILQMRPHSQQQAEMQPPTAAYHHPSAQVQHPGIGYAVRQPPTNNWQRNAAAVAADSNASYGCSVDPAVQSAGVGALHYIRPEPATGNSVYTGMRAASVRPPLPQQQQQQQQQQDGFMPYYPSRPPRQQQQPPQGFMPYYPPTPQQQQFNRGRSVTSPYMYDRPMYPPTRQPQQQNYYSGAAPDYYNNNNNNNYNSRMPARSNIVSRNNNYDESNNSNRYNMPPYYSGGPNYNNNEYQKYSSRGDVAAAAAGPAATAERITRPLSNYSMIPRSTLLRSSISPRKNTPPQNLME